MLEHDVATAVRVTESVSGNLFGHFELVNEVLGHFIKRLVVFGD